VWRKRLPAGSAHYIHRALRQVLRYGVRCRYIHENPAALIPNPAPKHGEMKIFSWPEIEAVAAELPAYYRAIPVFASASTRTAGSGSTPRRTGHGAVFRSVGVCSRSWTQCRLGSTLRWSSLGPRGGHLDLHNLRARHWKAALRAAGLEYRRPYNLRHTYATFSIAAGVSLFALARRMGTSLEMIDQTYGHLAPDADDYELGLLDAFDARISSAGGHFSDTAD
jgi:hypothetical protein